MVRHGILRDAVALALLAAAWLLVAPAEAQDRNDGPFGAAVLAVYANDFLQRPPAGLTGRAGVEVALVEGSPSNVGKTIALASGARLYVARTGALIFDPAGAFDRLDPGESARESFSYATEPIPVGPPLPVLPPDRTNGWIDNVDGSHTHVAGNAAALTWELPGLIAGATYRITFTVTGRTSGYVTPALASDIEVLSGGRTRVDGRIHVAYVVAPPGADRLRLEPKPGFDGTVGAVAVAQAFVTDATRERTIVIRASEQVGPNLVGVGDLEGSGWNGDNHNQGHTAEPALQVLAADLTGLVAGSVYLLAYTVTGQTNGEVVGSLTGETDAIADASYADGRHARLLRAPTAPHGLHFTTGAGFNGAISDVQLREVLASGEIAVPVLRASGGAGHITLDWAMEPAGFVPGVADTVRSGPLEFSRAYGLRDTDGTGSFLVHDAEIAGRRVGISLKGGEYLVVRDSTILGPSASDPEGQFQVGVNASDGRPFMRRTYLLDNVVDLGLASNQGSYETSNADAVVYNNLDRLTGGVAFHVNNLLAGGSDAAVDNKQELWSSHNVMAGGYRTVRTHGFASYNGFLDEILGPSGESQSGGALWLGANSARIRLFLCRIDGVQYADAEAMVASGAVVGNVTPEQAALATILWTTVPRFPDAARLNATDMEFEYSADGGVVWLPLTVGDIGLPGMRGRLHRVVAGLPPGTYQIRSRAWNGVHRGAWSNQATAEVH